MGIFGNFFVQTKEDIDRQIAGLYHRNGELEVYLSNYRNNKDTVNANTTKAQIAQNKAKIAALKAKRKTAPNKK